MTRSTSPLSSLREPFFAVVGNEHVETFGAQVELEPHGDARIVFDDQDRPLTAVALTQAIAIALRPVEAREGCATPGHRHRIRPPSERWRRSNLLPSSLSSSTRAAVGPHDVLDDGEPEPRSFLLPGQPIVDAVELLEDPLVLARARCPPPLSLTEMRTRPSARRWRSP